MFEAKLVDIPPMCKVVSPVTGDLACHMVAMFVEHHGRLEVRVLAGRLGAQEEACALMGVQSLDQALKSTSQDHWRACNLFVKACRRGKAILLPDGRRLWVQVAAVH